MFNSLVLKNFSKTVTLSKLLDVIACDDQIPTLEFTLHKWSDRDLKTLSNILASTKTIRRIELNAVNNAVKTIFEALESNTSVKEISLEVKSSIKPRTNQKYWEKLIEGLKTRKINVEALEFNGYFNPSHLKNEYLDGFLNALKAAKSFHKWIFKGCSDLLEQKYKEIGEILKNRQITSLFVSVYESLPPQVVSVLIDVVKMNNIKHLHLQIYNTRQLKLDLATAFSENTSMTDLDIEDLQIAPKMLEQILLNNRTLLKLNCWLDNHSVTPIEKSVVDALGKNTSLTDLRIRNAMEIEGALLMNTTIRTFSVKDSRVFLSGDLMKKIIQQNTTLTALDLRTHQMFNADTSLIIEGLASNTTLTSFGCNIETLSVTTLKSFCAMLSDHQTLTHIDSQPTSSLSILRMVIPGITDIIEDALKANLSLRSWSPYDSFEEFQPYFKRNINIQDESIRRTKTIIRMISLKPHSFLLPIEIWSQIFNQVHYPGVNIQFGELFYKH